MHRDTWKRADDKWKKYWFGGDGVSPISGSEQDYTASEQRPRPPRRYWARLNTRNRDGFALMIQMSTPNC